MKFSHGILALMILEGAAVASRPVSPITLCRSGRDVVVEVAADKNGRLPETVVLSAFGRVWTKPSPVENGNATIAVPEVRAPTVFDLATGGRERRVVGQLVAYHADDVEWQDKIVLLASGTPKWFGQWAGAVRLPVRAVAPGSWEDEQAPKPDASTVLIVGRGAAGKGPQDVIRLVRQHRVHVVVLDADWYGRHDGEGIDAVLGPKQAVSSLLADLRSQKWALPLEFRCGLLPWGGSTNREPLLAGMGELPLAELLCGEGIDPYRVVLSYVPWAQQLGRREDADATLLRLLAAAGSPSQERTWSTELRIVYPPLPEETKEAKVKAANGGPAEDAEQTSPPVLKDRPVLSAALARAATRSPSGTAGRLYVVDLRGSKQPEQSLATDLTALEDAVGERDKVLILGDDALLDDWKWLGLDREKLRPGRHSVKWLPADELPGSPADRIRLMQCLTEFEVAVMTWRPQKGTDDEAPDEQQ